jgi:hypothetical protein
MFRRLSQFFNGSEPNEPKQPGETPIPPVRPDYEKWREVIFKVTPLQGGLENDAPGQVFGVVMDVGMPNSGGSPAAPTFVISETAFATGEASLKTAFGGGVLGLGGHPVVAEHAKQIVRAAQALLGTTAPAQNFAIPTTTNVYFYFLTTSGVMFYGCPFSDIQVRSHPYAELFVRFSQIKKEADSFMDASKKK